MLKDSEIVELRNDSNYQSVTKAGLKKFVSDLLRQGTSDFKPEIGAILKFGYSFAKTRIIRKEIFSSGNHLLERFFNYELKWERSPQSVKDICQADSEGYIWMRYDETRVDALFLRCKALIGDAEYRNLIKRHSSIDGDKNNRLLHLSVELKTLHKNTIKSIRTKGLFDDFVSMQKEEYYENNESEIQKKFLEAARRGALGQIGDRRKPQEEGNE